MDTAAYPAVPVRREHYLYFVEQLLWYERLVAALVLNPVVGDVSEVSLAVRVGVGGGRGGDRPARTVTASAPAPAFTRQTRRLPGAQEPKPVARGDQ